MELRTIKRLLKAGFHPSDINAQLIGDGAQRQAFLLGDFVIKARVPAWHHDTVNNLFFDPCPAKHLYAVPRAVMRRIGILPPEQYTVGEWVVQTYYRPLTKAELKEWAWLVDDPPIWRNIRLDLWANLGKDLRTGTTHAFDW